MNPVPTAVPTAISEHDRRRAIGFLNWAHALDHYVMLIFPTVVIGLQAVYGRSYAELIALSTTSFVAFGVFSLPAGWLADHWSRRNMMAAFYLGCGASLLAAGFAPSPLLILSATAASEVPAGEASAVRSLIRPLYLFQIDQPSASRPSDAAMM